MLTLGPIAPSALAERMGMDASTLTRNLQPLVAGGWLVICPGPDARSRLINATPEGQAKRTEAQRRWRVAQEGINQALGLDRVLALHALIDESMELLHPVEDPDETA